MLFRVLDRGLKNNVPNKGGTCSSDPSNRDSSENALFRFWSEKTFVKFPRTVLSARWLFKREKGTSDRTARPGGFIDRTVASFGYELASTSFSSHLSRWSREPSPRP